MSVSSRCFSRASRGPRARPSAPSLLLQGPRAVLLLVAAAVLVALAGAADDRDEKPLSILESTMLMFAAQQQSGNQLDTPEQGQSAKEYDFIIVGAGTAGSVLANRLTEVGRGSRESISGAVRVFLGFVCHKVPVVSQEGDWRVLLLEAGRSGSFVMDIPLVASYIQFSDANWKYKTEPNLQACLGMEGRRCNFPRGKWVGVGVGWGWIRP